VEFIGDILRKKYLLRHGIEGTTEGRMEVEERRGEDVDSYWMTFRKGNYTRD
jgi:hypothetical protein